MEATIRVRNCQGDNVPIQTVCVGTVHHILELLGFQLRPSPHNAPAFDIPVHHIDRKDGDLTYTRIGDITVIDDSAITCSPRGYHSHTLYTHTHTHALGLPAQKPHLKKIV